jgi:hypothetical protein
MCALLAGRSGGAAVENLVADGESRTVGSYTTPVVVAPVGGPLALTNLDILGEVHNVVSDAFGPDTQPWCRFYAVGRCPLLWSPPTDNSRSSLVRGLENTQSQVQYLLHCTIYPEIRGILITF